MEDSKPPALVFGGGINGLGIVRNLGTEEVDVYLVVERSDQATYSKYCKKFFILPDFTKTIGRQIILVGICASEFSRSSRRVHDR